MPVVNGHGPVVPAERKQIVPVHCAVAAEYLQVATSVVDLQREAPAQAHDVLSHEAGPVGMREDRLAAVFPKHVHNVLDLGPGRDFHPPTRADVEADDVIRGALTRSVPLKLHSTQ